jgi:hypothetical protein
MANRYRYRYRTAEFVIIIELLCYVTSPGAVLTYLLTYLLTAWSRVLLEKLAGSAASQEIPRILWKPKVHYRIHKCPPPVPILSQLLPWLLLLIGPALYRLFTSHVPNLISLFRRSGRTKLSVRVRGFLYEHLVIIYGFMVSSC